MSQRAVPSLGCGYVIVTLLALGGGACLFLASQRHDGAGHSLPPPPVVWVPAVIGLVLLLAARTYARFAHRIVREHAEEERRRAEHPNEPWKWPSAWLGRHIASDDGKGLGFLWAFVVIWNALSLPGVIHIFSAPRRNEAAYLVLLFPLAGLGLLAAALYQTARRRKYGGGRFTPVTLPGVIGGHLGGVIAVPARVIPRGDLRVALRCIQKTVTGHGKSRRIVETVLWEGEERIPPGKADATAGLTTIPVLFPIPPGLPATDFDQSERQIHWRLTAWAETPGVDFRTTFTVPVFAV